MEAVRLRKENQIYSADEKRALAMFRYLFLLLIEFSVFKWTVIIILIYENFLNI